MTSKKSLKLIFFMTIGLLSLSCNVYATGISCITDVLMKVANGDPGPTKHFHKVGYWHADNGGARAVNEAHTNWSHNRSHIGLYIKREDNVADLSQCIGRVFIHTSNGGWGNKYDRKKTYSAVTNNGEEIKGDLVGVWDADGGGAHGVLLNQNGHNTTALYTIPYKSDDGIYLTDLYAWADKNSTHYAKPLYEQVGWWDTKGSVGYDLSGKRASHGDFNTTLLSKSGSTKPIVTVSTIGAWESLGNNPNLTVTQTVQVSKEYAESWSQDVSVMVSASYEAFGLGMSSQISTGFAHATSSTKSESHSDTKACAFKCGGGKGEGGDVTCFNRNVWQYKLTTYDNSGGKPRQIAWAKMCAYACSPGSQPPNFDLRDNNWAVKASASCK